MWTIVCFSSFFFHWRLQITIDVFRLPLTSSDYHWRLQITIDVFRLPLGIFKLFFLVWHILLALHFEFSSICSINRLWVSIILFIIIKKNLSKVNLSLWYLLTTCLGSLVYVLSKILKLFSFSVFLLWVYLMQVIPETHSCTLI